MISGHRRTVDTAAVAAGGADHLDMGATNSLHGHIIYVESCHADGTPAPVRARHSMSNSGADPAVAADMLICTDGNPYIFTVRKDPATGNIYRYLNVLGLSDGTILSAARYDQPGA